MGINPRIPENFEEKLDDYLKVVKSRKELNKRSFFESEVLVKWFNIEPRDIKFEDNKRDLYYAGILFETKFKLNNSKRKEAFEELSRYINENPDPVIEVVVTDLIEFEVYNCIDLIKNYDKSEAYYNKIINSNKEIYRMDEGKPEDIFNNLYKFIYKEQSNLPLDTNLIVPRLKNLIDNLSQNIKVDEDNIKFKAWTNFISVALGSKKEATIEVFKKYTILYYISILSVAKVLNISSNIIDIVNGNSFLAKGILNFTNNEDFFNILNYDDKILNEINNELNSYDFNSQNSEIDFFRLLYERLIAPSNRHSLGEFYTPEWLAKYLVDKLVTKNNIILDPACGSGTFLKLAIKKKKEYNSKNIESQIVGFDINPIAVIIAKANIILELKKPIRIIPVYVADSLMPELKIKQTQLESNFVKINFEAIAKGYGEGKFYFKPDGKDMNPNEMYEYIQKMKEAAENKIQIEGNLIPNKDIINTISTLISNNQDDIWFFIIQNIYNPYYYMNKVDVVIGNPPWLTYKDVNSHDRQIFLDTIYKDYGLGSGSKNKTHQDMAAFFIARSQEYLKDKKTGKIGFVLPKAIFNGSQYNSIRLAVSVNQNNAVIRGRSNHNQEGSNQNKLNLPKISMIFDIKKNLNPFRIPSCMIIFDFVNKSNEIDGIILDSIKSFEIYQIPIKVEVSKTKFYINIAGKESGISIKKLNDTFTSPYKNKFKQGSTIVPRSYYFIDINKEDKYNFEVSGANEYKISYNKKKRKKTWLIFPDNRIIEKHLVYDVIIGETINKYSFETKKIVLPILNGEFILKQVKNGNHYKIILNDAVINSKLNYICRVQNKNDEYKEILKNLFTNLPEIYQKFEDDWEEKRGSKFYLKGKQSEQMGIFDRLNYNNELLAQFKDKKNYMVVYNTSGKDIKCAIIENKEDSLNQIVIDSECYYYKTDDKLEAYYLEGILNSKFLIEKLINSGIKSERHIHKKIFELGIPLFNKDKPIHIKIAKYSQLLEKDNKNNLGLIEKLVCKILD